MRVIASLGLSVVVAAAEPGRAVGGVAGLSDLKTMRSIVQVRGANAGLGSAAPGHRLAVAVVVWQAARRPVVAVARRPAAYRS